MKLWIAGCALPIAFAQACSGSDDATGSGDDTGAPADVQGDGAAEVGADADAADAGDRDVPTDPDASGGDADAAETPDAGEEVDLLPEGPCGAVPQMRAPYAAGNACAHDVVHPTGIIQIYPSCGDDGPGGAPVHVHVGFASADASTALTFQWKTGADTRLTEVRYGLAPDALDTTAVGHSFTYGELRTQGRLVHEVHLCGLEPSTTYYYQVGGGDTWSEVHQVTTAPIAASTDEFTFAVTGDTREVSDFSVWEAGLARMGESAPDFIVFTGDAVEGGFSQSQWDGWFDAGGALADTVFLPTSGNHDLLSVNYLGQFALPGGEENYVVRYGNTVLISMNDLPILNPDAVAEEFRDFLDAALAAHADATWKILFNHRAFYSASNHGSQADLQEAWGPLLDAHQVDLVLNGHDHNYERSVPIRDGEQAGSGEGTTFVVAAGLGAPMYDSGTEWWTAISESVPSFAVITVSDRTLTFHAYRLDGTELDAFNLVK